MTSWISLWPGVRPAEEMGRGVALWTVADRTENHSRLSVRPVNKLHILQDDTSTQPRMTTNPACVVSCKPHDTRLMR